MLALAKSPYAKHLVVTMLRYGSSETREKILKEFHGRVRKLVRHRDAAPVLEFAYTTAANGPQVRFTRPLPSDGPQSRQSLTVSCPLYQQRRALLAEFYGPQYALFHSGRPLDEVRISARDAGRRCDVAP
jgi:pumilio family protein 6